MFTFAKFVADCFDLLLNSISYLNASAFLFHFEFVAFLKLKLLAKDCCDRHTSIAFHHGNLSHIKLYVWKCKFGHVKA